MNVPLDNVVDKNPRNGANGHTPLDGAAFFGYLNICQLMIKHLEVKNPKRNTDGMTPFHWAAKNGQLEVCNLFTENTEDKNPR